MTVSSAFDRFLKGLIGNKSNPVNLIPHRFIQVFEDHGIAVSQIPRLLPQIQLSDLKSEDTLLQVLNHEVLEQAAQLFGIRRQWLEGIDDRIYEYHSCYKEPEIFFNELGKFCQKEDNSLYFPARAFTIRKNLDYTDPAYQPLALVLADQITTFDNKDIFRYHIFNDEWNWSYAPARIQVKAMARLVTTVINVQIPLYVIEPNDIEALFKSTIIPGRLIGNCLISDPSLEDYTISNSYVGKEKDELPEVIKYIKEHQLEDLIIEVREKYVLTVKKTEIASVQCENLPKVRGQGKRVRNHEEVWAPARIEAQKLWREDDSLSIAEVIRRLKEKPDLKASRISESGIRKKIADLAPENIRGKSGRKPKKFT